MTLFMFISAPWGKLITWRIYIDVFSSKYCHSPRDMLTRCSNLTSGTGRLEHVELCMKLLSDNKLPKGGKYESWNGEMERVSRRFNIPIRFHFDCGILRTCLTKCGFVDIIIKKRDVWVGYDYALCRNCREKVEVHPIPKGVCKDCTTWPMDSAHLEVEYVAMRYETVISDMLHDLSRTAFSEFDELFGPPTPDDRKRRAACVDEVVEEIM